MNIYDHKEIFRYEPYIPLVLAGHGAAMLHHFNWGWWRWGLICAAVILSLTGIWNQSRSWVMARAIILALLAIVLIAATGMTSSFFTVWCFVIAATYPIIIPSWLGFAIPVGLAAAYSAMFLVDPYPIPPLVLATRCTFMVFIGFVTHEFGKRLIRLAKSERLANTDPLTGLYNRRYFFNKGQLEFERAARYDAPLSVLLVDCDKFKEINDKYGHDAGDGVLQAVANMIRNEVRKLDVPARIGGDEFSILLPNTDAEGAKELAQRLEESAESIIIDKGGESITTSISVGIGNRGPRATSFQDVIRAADEDMYKRKDQKRQGQRAQ